MYGIVLLSTTVDCKTVALFTTIATELYKKNNKIVVSSDTVCNLIVYCILELMYYILLRVIIMILLLGYKLLH
jgi:hypothetical protein